ncbi:MAG: pyridoxamine 5'-phosphate oxidase family protein [Syntrophaceae bacterium]|nr:pyridoxamine 5'-phosphate oxidase family protein [Syntrophaceae bacterium]
MEKTSQLKKFLKSLFFAQKLAVLATQSRKQPYGSLVAFMATNDLKYLLFATNRTTRKYANIIKNPKVAMVVDNRSNEEADFHEATAVTITGKVQETEGSERKELQKLFLRKHPSLKDFLSSPTCVLFKMEVETYYVVNRFQNVVALQMKKRELSSRRADPFKKGSKSENLHLAGVDRFAEIDCRRSFNKCDQILCSREMGSGEDFRFAQSGRGQ